ncbi:NfeD family protein [Roseomonas sp. SG15]|uniref:NfeD family protein n=2 Tax=Roseomonas indoligenes TaxID=2820811 RepID=A0A940MZN2_9PROT|nr:NfeD family protein [Pararoseomonas indoligenes]MBP0493396.1 NfeD family protein [Pararoseomonas indoligenes]
MVLPGAFLLWAGMAAVGTGLVGLAVAPGFPVSVVVFAVLLAAGIAIALRRRRSVGSSGINTPEAGLVGREGVVQPSAGPGLRVRVGDSDWAARAEGAALPPGALVRVDAVEGTVLLVRALG